MLRDVSLAVNSHLRSATAMDDSDCNPRPHIPRISVPFCGPIFGTGINDFRDASMGSQNDRETIAAAFSHGTVAKSRFPIRNHENTESNVLSPSHGDATPSRGFTPRPIQASPPPTKDGSLDDSLSCLTPEGTRSLPASLTLLQQPSDEKENQEVEESENGVGRSDVDRIVGKKRWTAHNAKTRSSGDSEMKSLTRNVQKMAISVKQKDAKSQKTVHFSSSSKTKGALARNSSASNGVKLYVHGIPGGGTKKSSVIPSVTPSVIPKAAKPTSISQHKTASKESSCPASSVPSIKSKPSLSTTSKRPFSSKTAAKTVSSSSRPKSMDNSSRSTTSTTGASTASIPSSRPEPNSILRLTKSSASLVAEQSFDSIAAAEDLLQEDSILRKTVHSKAALRTNVQKDEKVFDNLIPLPDRNDVDQLLEEATARRRKAQRKMLGGRNSASSSRTGRRNGELELVERLEPDIRDFWNPEWEIGRPDWSLPFGASNVVVGDIETDKRAVEQSADLSDVARRIEERFERGNKAKNSYRMFYRN